MLARSTVGFLIALCCGGVHAVDWYTVTGDKSNLTLDTTQIDASTVDRRGKTLGLRFRVTLAKPRTLPDGEIYQSYLSHIAVECASSSIFHEDQQRFTEPLWQGKVTFESFVQPKPMAFARLSPDPRPLILAAACESRRSNTH